MDIKGRMLEISMEILQDPEIMGEYKATSKEAKAAVAAWVDGTDPATVKAVPGADRWCRDMVGHGAKLAICTSDSRANTVVGLKAATIDPALFTTQLCADDPDSITKPDPTNIRTVCAKMCAAAAAEGQRPVLWPTPEQVVMVGDSPLDVEMGVAAGSRSVGVLTGVSTAEQLDCAGATVVAPSLGSVYIAPDANALRTDVLVVGGGSAGCTAAARLAAADSSLEVTMLEAGMGDRERADSWHIHMPAALTYNIGHPKFDWCYETEPQPHLDGRKLAWPRGKVLGGSSSLNAMVYVRGHPADYDRWAAQGAVGWGWDDVLPYYRKSEAYSHYNSKTNAAFRGDSGPLRVTRPPVEHSITAAFLEAGRQAGYPVREDLNSVHCGDGIAPMDFTIHEGKRWSAAEAHLGAESGAPLNNLRVATGVHTHRVLFAGNRAIGVEASLDGPGSPPTPIYADKVVLSAGAINTPQLLMLSGVGDAEDLHAHGIECRSHLPGVGKNLQDHMEIYVQQFSKSKDTLYGAQWQFPHKMVGIGLEWIGQGTGWGGTNHMEAGGFVKSHDGIEHPNLQFHMFPGMLAEQSAMDPRGHGYQLHVGPMRPTSVGELGLKTASAFDAPWIDPKALSTEHDMQEMRDCVSAARNIFAQDAFKPFADGEAAPGTNADIDAFIRANAASAYHPCGTCRMGPATDPLAVVDSTTLKLHGGVEGLHVLDASLMPSIISGNLNGCVIMMAEKGSDLIRKTL